MARFIELPQRCGMALINVDAVQYCNACDDDSEVAIFFGDNYYIAVKGPYEAVRAALNAPYAGAVLPPGMADWLSSTRHG